MPKVIHATSKNISLPSQIPISLNLAPLLMQEKLRKGQRIVLDSALQKGKTKASEAVASFHIQLGTGKELHFSSNMLTEQQLGSVL